LLYILYGADDYSINHELDLIKKSAGDPSMLATNTVALDGGAVTENDLRVACETVPFLADKRLVLVYGLIERFSPHQSARVSSRKSDIQITGYEIFGGVINGLPPTTILVLLENELRDSNPLFKIITTQAQVKAFPSLKTPQLRDWIIAYVGEQGSIISPAAVASLTRLIGSNLWIMSSELQKLILYTGGQKIEEKDVKALVSYAQQSNVFTMADAIVEFNIQKAETMMQQLFDEGNSPTQMLNMLTRQMRLIVRARELKQQRLSETEIRSRMGLAGDWLVRKTLEQANRYTFPRLKQVYQLLLETDLAIKTGKYDGELALNILIAELCLPQKSDVSSQRMHGVAA